MGFRVQGFRVQDVDVRIRFWVRAYGVQGKELQIAQCWHLTNVGFIYRPRSSVRGLESFGLSVVGFSKKRGSCKGKSERTQPGSQSRFKAEARPCRSCMAPVARPTEMICIHI